MLTELIAVIIENLILDKKQIEIAWKNMWEKNYQINWKNINYKFEAPYFEVIKYNSRFPNNL